MKSTTQAYRAVTEQTRRDELILSHLGLVRHVIGRLAAQLPAGTDLENLESAGTLGLVEAASSFDPSRGVEFRAYAYGRIRGAVLDELRRNCPLPQNVLERVARVRRAYERLRPPVTVEALAAATGLTSDEVSDSLAAMRMTRMMSLEASGEPAQPRSDRRSERPEAALERAEQKRVLAAALAALPERERLAITLYYLEELRLKEIAHVLHLSESRVSRLLSAALFQLGEQLRPRES